MKIINKFIGYMTLIGLYLPMLTIAVEAKDNILDGMKFTKIVTCDTYNKKSENLKKHGEYPLVWMDGVAIQPMMQEMNSKFIISYNSDTSTWTLLEVFKGTDGSDYACVLGQGKSKIYFNQAGIEEPKGQKI